MATRARATASAATWNEESRKKYKWTKRSDWTEHHCGLHLLEHAAPCRALTHYVRRTYTTVIMVLGVSFFALYLLPNEIYLEYVSNPEQLADTRATTSEIFSTIDFYFPQGLTASRSHLSECLQWHTQAAHWRRTCKRNSHGKFQSIEWWCVRHQWTNIFRSREFEAQKLILFIHISCLVHRKAQQTHAHITLRHLRSTCKRGECSRQSFCLRIISCMRADNRTLDTLRFSGVNILWRPNSACVSAHSWLFSDPTTTPMDRTMNVNYIVDAVDLWKCVRCEIESLNIDW